MSWLSAVGAALFAAGAIAGWWLCRDRAARSRAEQLERELEEAERGHLAYREQVEKHFTQTSELFRDLTHQYRAAVAHLAQGARDLCTSEVPALGAGLDFAVLVQSSPPSSAEAQPTERRAGPARGDQTRGPSREAS